MAMSFLDVFRKKAPVRNPKDEPISPIVMMGGRAVRFLSSEAVMTAEIAQRKSSQLYRITNFVAASVQSVPWYCEADPESIPSERANPGAIKKINDLLRSPNDTFTQQQFRYWLVLNLMLYARAHFKIGLGASGEPNAMYPLAAKYVRGVLNEKGTVEAYEYGLGSNMTVFPTRKTSEKKAGGVAALMKPYGAEISFPSLSGLVEYNKEPAAIESIAMPIAIINALMQRALDTASGHPNIKYIITSEKTLTRQQKEALTSHLEEAGPGGEEGGSVLFVYNTEIKVHKLDNELGDIHSKIPLDDMTRQIAGVFGVPIPLLGLGSADAAKYASNYGESRLSFWQDTVVPSYLSPIASAMTQAICPPGARVNFDLDSIPALWEGRAALGKTLSAVTFLTTNEKRAVLDFEPTTEIPAIAPTISKPSGPSGADAEVPDGSTESTRGQVLPLRSVDGGLQ